MYLLVFAAFLQAPVGGDGPTPLQPKLVSSPNWADKNNYPPKARDAEQEGRVNFRLSIDERGRPIDCAIELSSGSVHLDSGTCRLAIKMRFQPPLGPDGQPLGSVYQSSVVWLLDEPRAIAASWLDADVLFHEDGSVRECTARGEGPYLAPWGVTACTLATELAGRPGIKERQPLRLTLSARVKFRRSTQLPNWPEGTLLARDVTRFSIDNEGDATRCSPDTEGEMVSNSVTMRHPCGQFLAQIWFETPPLKESPPRGDFEFRLIAPAETRP